MSASAMLHVRLDERLKERGNAVLDAIGLTSAEAVRLLYHRLIAEQGFPLELKVPNAESRMAMAEADEILAERRARFVNGDELMASLEARGQG